MFSLGALAGLSLLPSTGEIAMPWVVRTPPCLLSAWFWRRFLVGYAIVFRGSLLSAAVLNPAVRFLGERGWPNLLATWTPSWV